MAQAIMMTGKQPQQLHFLSEIDITGRHFYFQEFAVLANIKFRGKGFQRSPRLVKNCVFLTGKLRRLKPPAEFGCRLAGFGKTYPKTAFNTSQCSTLNLLEIRQKPNLEAMPMRSAKRPSLDVQGQAHAQRLFGYLRRGPRISTQPQAKTRFGYSKLL